MDNRPQGEEDAKATQRAEHVRVHPGVARVVHPVSYEHTPSECNSDNGHKVYDREEGTGRGEQEAKCNGKGTDKEYKKEAGPAGNPLEEKMTSKVKAAGKVHRQQKEHHHNNAGDGRRNNNKEGENTNMG